MEKRVKVTLKNNIKHIQQTFNLTIMFALDIIHMIKE